jgi:hypothetical protein
LQLLKDGDAKKLSQWYIDDAPAFSASEAAQVLAYYAQYDLSRTNVESFGYDDAAQEFVALVSDADGWVFEIRIVCSDGLTAPARSEIVVASAVAAAREYLNVPGIAYYERIARLTRVNLYESDYTDLQKDETIALQIEMRDEPRSHPQRLIVLTREYGGDWVVIEE